MKFTSLFLISLALSCGPKTKKTEPIISDNSPIETEMEEVISEPDIIEATQPTGAVSGNYNGTNTPFYAQAIHASKSSKTVISFEASEVTKIQLTNTYGASLYPLTFKEFDRDLLLIAAKTKDPIFIKYYLYQYKNGQWKQVVEPFTLHVSHTTDNFIPIKVDPKNPRLMFRHYSVFDLDKDSKLGYTWRLLTESVPILNN